jgi:hypothetical protein
MEGFELGWNQFTNPIEEGTIDGLEMDNDSGEDSRLALTKSPDRSGKSDKYGSGR